MNKVFIYKSLTFIFKYLNQFILSTQKERINIIKLINKSLHQEKVYNYKNIEDYK